MTIHHDVATCETLSRRIFLVEVVLIAAPFSLTYVVFGAEFLIRPALTTTFPPTLANGVLAAVVLCAVCASWALIVSFLRAGASGLRRRSAVWWIVALSGAIVVLAAVVSRVLPPSMEYSRLDLFRDDLHLFLLGVPLLVPLAHLLLERMRRSGTR